jgi:DNA (cytosine-5)-methyltransferase 1
MEQLLFSAFRASAPSPGSADHFAGLATTNLLLHFRSWKTLASTSSSQLESVLIEIGANTVNLPRVQHALRRISSNDKRMLTLNEFRSLGGSFDPAWTRWVQRQAFGHRALFGIDVFAGSGGMSLGFQHAGFQIAAAVEMNPVAAATYARNHRATTVLCQNVSLVGARDLLTRAGLVPGDVSVLFGGPPCQGFSESNRRTRNTSNKRNYLYREMIRLAEELQPQWLVLENVAGLKTIEDGHFLKAILEDLGEIGYKNPEVAELNAADFGVPQSRRRLFIVASRTDNRFVPPAPTHGPGRRKAHVTVREAISDLPVLRNGAVIDVRPYRLKEPASEYQKELRCGSSTTSHLVTRSAENILARYRRIRPGENWEALPSQMLGNYQDASRCHTGLYYRLRWNETSKVVGNFRKSMIVHPSQTRGLSVREAARLQSFPDSHRFEGSIGYQQQQVADAVPPLLARAVALVLKSSLSRVDSI